MGNRIYFKIAGFVDLDMLHIFAIKLNIYLYTFWNIRRTVLKFYKFDEKRAITPRWVIRFTQLCFQGQIQEGAHPARTNPPPPLKLEKNIIFWLKIMIFHTKYPNKISCLPTLGAIFLSAPPPPPPWNPRSAPACPLINYDR
jgi:hypothetical protein